LSLDDAHHTRSGLDLEERQALVETAATALHFEWWLSSLRGHERWWSLGRDIVLPLMQLIVHVILAGSSLAMVALTDQSGG
jgi:hypothetical protein